MFKLEYSWLSDNWCDVYVNNIFVGSLNHENDDLVRSSMKNMIDMLNEITRITNAKVTVVGEPGV